jgi:prepilin-type processing-associated H-X9-DG protein
VLKFDNSSMVQWVYFDQQRISRIPGNVIIMMESLKPNYNLPSGNTYKCYFTSWPDLFNTSTPAAKSTASLTFNRIGTWHNRMTKMNCLFADGHIGLADPKKDFFSNPADQRTVKEYLWDAAINPGVEGGSPPTYQTTPAYPNGGWKPGVNPGF